MKTINGGNARWKVSLTLKKTGSGKPGLATALFP